MIFLIYATNLENFLICGMINTNLVNFEDTFFLENIIYNELKARDYEVFTGKTYKGGMDFVVIKERNVLFRWHINIVDFLLDKKDINLS